jgi:hypothetical protein
LAYSNTYDFEFSTLSAYSRLHRSVIEIDTELATATDKHLKLQLRVELAESQLEHFCHQKMNVARGADYAQTYTQPKALLTTARLNAKTALNKYEIEQL